MKEQYILVGLFLIIASIFLSFSLHISFHYHVHHKPKNKLYTRVLDLIISVLLGLPFHSYQIQHFIHHKYDNGHEDFTSTYKIENGELKAKSLFMYTFFWFLNILKAPKLNALAKKNGFLDKKVQQKINIESVFLLLTISIFTLINPLLIILYISMIYIGWAIMSMHNYGQHLPELQTTKKGYSYYGKFYNWLTLNNGLHYEHHQKPALHYWDLKEQKEQAGINIYTHVIDPIRFKTQSKES